MCSFRSREHPEQNAVDSLWTLGGLSLTELLRRTITESWKDEVFGQGGRMAFYQFLALFPCLCVCMAAISRMPQSSHRFYVLLSDVSNQVFPFPISQLLKAMLLDFRVRAISGIQLASVCAAAVWASHNGTWAMIYGLNQAYEVDEQRSWWKLTVTIVCLTICFATAAGITILLLLFSTYLKQKTHHTGLFLHALEWLALLAALSSSFGILYRFAPNLRNQRWRWSTPGALCALILWISGALLARVYFEHVSDYTRSYGRLNGVAMLLLWLYISNGAILIGGEMNSEIQKAEAERDPSLKQDRVRTG